MCYPMISMMSVVPGARTFLFEIEGHLSDIRYAE